MPKRYYLQVFVALIFAVSLPGILYAQASLRVKAPGHVKPWVSAYYASWQDTYLPPSAIDFGAFSHLIHFAMLPRPNGTINDTSLGSITPAQSQEVVTAAHRAGRKVLLCFGGADSIGLFRPALADAVRPVLVRNMVQLLIARGYDGADIDIEPLGDADALSYEKLIRELHTQMKAANPKLLLTAATASQPALFARLQPDFDQINLMTYDLSGPWEGFKTWYNSALYDNGAQKMIGTIPYPSVQGMVQRFTAAGVSKSKLGIGLAFYGDVWSGASAPGQSITGVKVEDSVDYHTIMDTYYRPERYHWDDQAKAPYLSVTGPALTDSKFISYDDARLCALKIAYLKQQHLGGAIIWELGSGYRASQPKGQKDVLLQAVKKAWLFP
jgi:chitinase